MLKISFSIMYKDIVVDDVKIDGTHICVKKLVPDSLMQPLSGENINYMRVYSFLKSRCYEDGRADLLEILHHANMTSNNVWQWNQVTHGVTWEDCFWIRYEGEKLTWNEVRWR